jgi:hypothetical protein
MKVIDFHPDDLLDRELSGVLSASEQRRLLEHLEQCQTCRLERQLRADFRAELAWPALDQALQSSVSGALRAASEARAPAGLPGALPAGALPGGSGSVREALRSPRARRRRVLPALAGVAIVVASGVAAAKNGWGERVWELARAQAGNVFGGDSAQQGRNIDKGRDVTPATPAVERPAAVASDVESARESAQEVDPASAEVAAASGEVAAGGGEVAAGGAPSVKRARARARKAAGAAQAVTAARGRSPKPSAQGAVERSEESVRTDANNSRVVSSVASPAAEAVLVSNQAAAATPESVLEGTPAASPAPQAPVVSAATLFDQASSARRQGRIAEALRLYASLRERFITSPEARLSLALVARMRLDQGEPEAAIDGFEAYLATFDGALREQAMAGRALALGRLGLTSQEKAGWRDLLRAYPNSSYAELAERRLGDGAIR